jgi:hypothetical protein
MGAALGDIDFDGDLDWFVTSIFGYGMAYNKTITGNRLLRNPGGDFAGEQFENITESSGVADGRWGWAACFVDIDNDADLDIYQTNGWAYEFGSELFFDDPTRVFIADSSGIQFTDEAQNLGLADSHDARGAICADFDNDGDIDIFQLTNKPVNSGVLWGNVSAASGRNALRVRLVGLPPNTEASGARIFATIGSTTQMREIILGNNYLGQNPAVQVIGLGTASSVDSLRVEWPALLAGSPPVPTQPDEWVRGSVPASAPGQTLVICHPALISPPAECEAPD